MILGGGEGGVTQYWGSFFVYLNEVAVCWCVRPIWFLRITTGEWITERKADMTFHLSIHSSFKRQYVSKSVCVCVWVRGRWGSLRFSPDPGPSYNPSQSWISLPVTLTLQSLSSSSNLIKIKMWGKRKFCLKKSFISKLFFTSRSWGDSPGGSLMLCGLNMEAWGVSAYVLSIKLLE